MRAIQNWNAAHEVGRAVRVLRDDGTFMHTKTRSAAWLMGGHTAMIMVEGLAGGYVLDRVTPA